MGFHRSLSRLRSSFTQIDFESCHRVIEVGINFYVLLINLSGVSAVWKKVSPILIGEL
jgi:hypothetical protein